MEFLSRVNPQLREGLSAVPLICLPDGLEHGRQLPPSSSACSGTVEVVDRTITGGDGQALTVRVYLPIEGASTSDSLLLWMHGGGYVMGHPANEDDLCIEIAETVGCIVISPDYRLAPEHPYPAGLEDCYAALQWAASEENGLNNRINRIAVGGGSAGGGLAAALALLARDRGGPSICFQMPLYPMIDDRNITYSSHEITDHRAVWYRSNNISAWKMYLGDLADGETSSYAAPSRASDLSGLPPAYLCVGQLDPFRDETIEFARRLAEAGVDVELHVYPGCFHAFEHVAPNADISRRAKQDYIEALRLALNV